MKDKFWKGYALGFIVTVLIGLTVGQLVTKPRRAAAFKNFETEVSYEVARLRIRTLGHLARLMEEIDDNLWEDEKVCREREAAEWFM
jgi:hypothetical protein